MTTEIIEKKEKTLVESLITQAIDKGVPVETMERLLTMRRELKAEYAKEAFDRAMAKFQGDCPVIVKSEPGGKTNSGQVAYYYAPLDVIVSQTKKLIQENGFSYAIETETLTDKVKVTCTIKHEAGHSESSSVEVPLGTKTQVMSASQVVASALTFAKRYAFCNSFGILTGDKDDDAEKTKTVEVKPVEKVESPKISDTQKLKHLCKLLGIDLTDKDKAAEEVSKLTGIAPSKENRAEIVSRLEMIVNERNNKN